MRVGNHSDLTLQFYAVWVLITKDEIKNITAF